jgi:hypothetical protein
LWSKLPVSACLECVLIKIAITPKKDKGHISSRSGEKEEKEEEEKEEEEKDKEDLHLLDHVLITSHLVQNKMELCVCLR